MTKKKKFISTYFIFNRTALFDSERHLGVVIQSRYDKSQPFCLVRANNHRGCTKYFFFSFFHFHFLPFLHFSLSFLVILYIYKHFLYSNSFSLNFLKTFNSEVNLKAFTAHTKTFIVVLLFPVSGPLDKQLQMGFVQHRHIYASVFA